MNDIPGYIKLFSSMIMGKIPEPFKFLWIHKDGTERWGEGYFCFLRRGRKKVGIQAILKNITELKQAEEERRVYETGIKNAHDGIAFTKLNGDMLHFNAAACKIFGFTPAEMKKINISKFSATSGGKKKLEESIREKGEFSGEIIGVRKNGEMFPAILSVSIVNDEKGNPMGRMGVFRDITERMQVEEELRGSEERFRSLVEASPDGITLTDLDGKILMCNPQTMILHGFENMEELVGKSSLEFISPEDQQKAMDNLEKTFQEGTVRNIEYALLKKDGTLYPGELSSSLILDKKGKPMAFMAVIRDITEQKQAEKALQKSEEKYRTLLESITDSVYVLDRDWRHIMVNDAASDFVKIPKEKLLTNKLPDLFPGIKQTSFFKTFERVMKTRIPDIVVDEFTFEDGRKDWYEVHVYPVPEGILCISRNITKRISAEKEKDRLQAQLVQSEKMAGIGTLTSGIAYEFNNLLQIMSGHTEFAQRTQKPEDMEEALEIVGNTSDRVSKIIKDLLTFSRRDALERELSSIPELIDFVLSMTEEHLKKHNIKVVREYGKVPNVEVNKDEVQQVFLNMVTNARDAMLLKGGKLEIGIKKVKDNVEISFTDSGIGIEEENLGRVFEPFYTTKGAVGGDAKTQGIGLGLSVSYGIVERHGGMIEVESKAQKKTTFTVRLPARVEKAEKRVVKEKKEVKVKKTKPVKVLVIDDEEEILKMFTKWLSAEGHQVKSVLTGEKAIGLVKKESFDIVFLDIVMPGIPAIDTLAEIKELSPKTKIFMITGKLVDKELWKELKAKGASGYLQKPFKIENIKNCLAKIRD